MTTTSTSDPIRVIHDYYRLADEGSAEAALALFSEDVEIRFGNTAPTTGVEGLVAAAEGLSAVCKSMSHRITNVFVDRDGRHGVSELAMTYVRHDGSEFSVPAAGVFAFQDNGLISKYHVFVDLTGLTPAP